ncbi:MAG: hypothetical protein IJ205_02910 [Bacteroidales bacterium]|nr:hypothetical protein [Bacteroidales bacterium]
MDNQPIILEEYAKCVEGTMRIHGEMIENWSAKYPSLRQEFEEASTADLSRVIRRYQQDMIDFSNSIQKSSME